MSAEPITEHDYEFHFKGGGDPLFLTLREGRDDIAANSRQFTFLRKESPALEQSVVVNRSELRGWLITTRTFQPEPERREP